MYQLSVTSVSMMIVTITFVTELAIDVINRIDKIYGVDFRLGHMKVTVC